MTTPADPYDLARFVTAQEKVYPSALAEIRDGHKVSHWMWYIFPQFAGLGSSSISRQFAIKSEAEAEAYLSHPILGPRLIECCDAVLAVDGKSASDIFGTPDDLKLRSCVTLFATVAPLESVFVNVLNKYYNSEPDSRTLRLIEDV